MAIDPFISLFLRSGFALILGFAALHKLRDLPSFRGVLTGYRLIPSGLIGVASGAIPLVEIAIAIALIQFALFGVLAAVALMAVYAVVMAFNIVRGNIHIDCGCFWGDSKAGFATLSWSQVGRNIVLISLLAIALLPATQRGFSYIDTLNLVLGLGFGYAAIKSGLTLQSIYNRMREHGHV